MNAGARAVIVSLFGWMLVLVGCDGAPPDGGTVTALRAPCTDEIVAWQDLEGGVLVLVDGRALALDAIPLRFSDRVALPELEGADLFWVGEVGEDGLQCAGACASLIGPLRCEELCAAVGAGGGAGGAGAAAMEIETVDHGPPVLKPCIRGCADRTGTPGAGSGSSAASSAVVAPSSEVAVDDIETTEGSPPVLRPCVVGCR